jgi:hypothetical protein
VNRDESDLDRSPQVGPEPPDPKVTDSDPSGSGPQGLAGGMGVSSERTGRVPGAQGEATHGAVDPYPELPADQDPPPEKSAGGSEVHPDNDLPPHRFDRSTYQGHSHG